MARIPRIDVLRFILYASCVVGYPVLFRSLFDIRGGGVLNFVDVDGMDCVFWICFYF